MHCINYFFYFIQHISTNGNERIDEVFDSSVTINRAVDYYKSRGYDDKWIKARLDEIVNRHNLTDIWKEGNIFKEYEYEVLTNKIYKE